jgi:hypothetical protein
MFVRNVWIISTSLMEPARWYPFYVMIMIGAMDNVYLVSMDMLYKKVNVYIQLCSMQGVHGMRMLSAPDVKMDIMLVIICVSLLIEIVSILINQRGSVKSVPMGCNLVVWVVLDFKTNNMLIFIKKVRHIFLA